MSTPAPSPSVDHSPAPTGTSPSAPSRRDRWQAVFPLISLLVLIAVMWIGAVVADEFPTEEVTWGFVFGAFVLTIFYAPLPLLATLVTAFTGVLAKQPSVVRVATVIGVVVASLCGVAAVIAGMTSMSDDIAGRVFGLSMIGGGLVALATLALLRRPAHR